MASSSQQHVSNSSGVNSITPLSIADSCDSPPTTSTDLKFNCQANKNLNGNQLFPLAENCENAMKHTEKMSWHNLLKHLKSQRIVKNIEIFKTFKSKQKPNLNTQKFPLAQSHMKMENFPLKITMEDHLYDHDHLKRKEKKWKKFKFPLKLTNKKKTFPYNSQGSQSRNEKDLKAKGYKIRQLNSKLKHSSYVKRTLRKLPIDTNLKRFPVRQGHFKTNKEFLLQHNLYSLCRNNKKDFKFPLKLSKNKGSFPFVNKSQTKTNLFLPNSKAKFQIEQISELLQNVKTYEEHNNNQNLTKKFPCQLLAFSNLSKFPINNQFTQHEHSFNENNLGHLDKLNMYKYPKTSNSLPSLSMTQSDQEIKNIDNEHVLQVQDAQIEENPPTLATNENKHPPPQIAKANRVYDDVNILAAGINSINNNTRPNEVGYYAEKIELLQDVIVALFEKIQNSLTTNHNTEHESTNAAKYDHGDGNNRFALTPPMSVTSVRNTNESNNHNKDVLCKKYDLADLCDHQVGQIVECSDVRDTLAEAVDYGVTKEKTKSTGSFLVKSEELTSPNSPITPNPPLNESEYTSYKDYTDASELLAKNNVLTVNKEINVDVKHNLEFESNNTICTQYNKSNELTHETVKNTRNIAKANEMTVCRLKKPEQENTQETNSSKINAAFEHKNNILYNDCEINEMKYEMNSVKGALQSSVSERALGKHDNLKSGTNSTDTPLSNKRLSLTLTSTKNPTESSYARRSSLKNENSSLAATVPKRSTLATTHPRQDGIVNLSAINSPSINDNTSNRANLNSTRTLNDSSGDALSHRRPSLGYLRNIQSTSLLSVDLPRCDPFPALVATDKTTLVNRAVSIDSSVLPERTRLRRLRRLRTQDSKDEPEDPMERLNLLKARISASLSEVKGVLKQYSTEAENDNENQTTNAVNSVTTLNAVNSEKEIKEKEEEKKEGPITFRFVKKIRRRSLFSEDDEPEEKQPITNAEPPKEETDNYVQKRLEIKDEKDNCKLKTKPILPSQNCGIAEVPNEKPVEKQVEAKDDVPKQPLSETNQIELNTNLYTLKEDAQEAVEDIQQTKTKPQITIVEPQAPKDEVQRLKEETKGAIPKPTLKHETNKLEHPTTQETSKKMKKKIIIKSIEPSRRASLAAVEGSKIEPAVKLAIPAKIQRRTSDSEAMLKKKLITDKLNTSGVVEEVTPKPKIVKVKRSSIKINNNSQLATEQTKLKEAETNAKVKSDNLIKPIDKDDNKSIHTDKSKDVLMPKQPEAERQQQINSEITSQTNALLPTQLVIDDEVASLNEKTIKNSMLPSRQLQQKQQQQLEQHQQTTINSTATNFISNDLQAKGAMLENVTTVLSLPAASEANGQIKREHVVQQEDFHDLLQQEIAIIKPSTTNKQNEIKLIKQIKESDQSNVKDINDKLNGNLKSVQTTTKEQQQQQQKLPTLHQQVIATAGVAHVKSYDDNNNKNENIKAKESLKEPCKDKTITSSHLEAEHQQRGEKESITNIDDTKTISSPHNSISSTSDITDKTTSALLLPSETVVEKKAEASANQQSTMPEFQLALAPVQTADIRSHPELHQKKNIIKTIVRQTLTDKTKKVELDKTKSEQIANEPASDKPQPTQTAAEEQTKVIQEANEKTPEIPSEIEQEELNEECSETTEISESSNSIGSEELTATQTPKKERIVKKKVIIKRQKRRLSIGDSFFHTGNSEEQQNAEIETLEKPISYFTDDEAEQSDEKDEEADKDDHQEHEDEKKPLKSCILHKEYNIGDEVLYAERFKKTQIKWRRGRVKERITSISYLLDIDGKDVSSHINYLKRFTGRKVSFGGKEYLEIDYEQLAEEEEKAERLQRRTYSIWNMV